MSSPAGDRVNAVTLVFTSIAGVTVCLRLFTRLALVRQTGFEDGCITFAMILAIGLAVTMGEQARNGMGMHIFDLSEKQMIESQKAFWASVWMYNLSLTVTKMSILLQYLTIFPTRRFQIACYVVLAFVSSYGLWTLFGNIFMCTPVAFFWNKTIPGGKCLNQFAVWFTNGAVNILQDIVILILPMPVLRNLPILKGQKRALMVMFALGGLVCIVSIARLQSLVRISNSIDPTFDNPPAATLSAIECNVGIICACLPYMRPLLSSLFPTNFPEIASQFVRPDDEERGQHMRKLSASSSQPYTPSKASISSHSRTNSTNSTSSSKSSLQKTSSNTSHYTDEGDLNMYKLPTPRTATFVKGHARQVTIGSSIGSARMLPFSLPRKPLNTYRTGSLEQVGKQDNVLHSLSSPRAPQLYRPMTPLAQKPLPITPFPVAHPATHWK